MQFDKSQILDLLKSQGDHGKAAQADSQLPDKVDPQRDSGLLSKLGIDPQQLIAMLTGGGGARGGHGGGLSGLAGGLGGMLGKK